MSDVGEAPVTAAEVEAGQRLAQLRQAIKAAEDRLSAKSLARSAVEVLGYAAAATVARAVGFAFGVAIGIVVARRMGVTL